MRNPEAFLRLACQGSHFLLASHFYSLQEGSFLKNIEPWRGVVFPCGTLDGVCGITLRRGQS